MNENAISYFEQRIDQLEKEGASDFDIAEAMTDMEVEFNIPLINDPSWNNQNYRIIKAYRRLSHMRTFQEDKG